MKKLLTFLISLFFFINIATLNNQHNWGDDFTAYIGQSRAIVDGRMADFANISNFRVASSEIQVGPNLYPWGYPLILTPFIGLFGINIAALKFVNYLFFIGSLIVTYYLFKEKLKKQIVLLIILVMAASPYFFDFKQNVLSDIPAMFFLLLSVLLIQLVYLKKSAFKHRETYLILLSLSIFISFFIRTSSFTIIPLLFLVQMIEHKKWLKDFRDILLNSIPYLIFLAGYLITSLIFPAGSYSANHTFFNSNFLKLAADNFYYYAVTLTEFFGNNASISGIFGAKTLLFFQTLYCASLLLFLTGVLKSWRKNYLYIVFFALNLGLFLVYQYTQGLRFIISLVPFYLFFVFAGIKSLNLRRLLKISFEKIIYASGFLLVLFFAVQIYSTTRQGPPADGPYSQNSQELFEFIKNNTATAESVSFYKPRAMNLFTGRKSVYIGSAEFLNKIYSPDYYAYTKDTDMKSVEDYLNENGKLIFQNDKFRLYDLR